MQQALRALFKAHCYTDHHLWAVSTHVHAKAQTPFGRFIVDILYKHVCKNTVTNQTVWHYAITQAQTEQ